MILQVQQKCILLCYTTESGVGQTYSTDKQCICCNIGTSFSFFFLSFCVFCFFSFFFVFCFFLSFFFFFFCDFFLSFLLCFFFLFYYYFNFFFIFLPPFAGFACELTFFILLNSNIFSLTNILLLPHSLPTNSQSVCIIISSVIARVHSYISHHFRTFSKYFVNTILIAPFMCWQCV